MISETVIPTIVTDYRKDVQAPFTASVVYGDATVVQPRLVLTTIELLARLKERRVRNGQIAKALDITPSRVTEIMKGDRSIKLDEAAKLVVAFDLEEGPFPPVAGVPPAVARLIVRYIAGELELYPAEQQIADLAEDVRAFSEFVLDPKVRNSVESAEAFFQAMRLRRPRPEPEAQPEKGRSLSE